MTTFTVETIEPQAAAVIRAEVFMAELRGVSDRAFPEVVRVGVGPYEDLGRTYEELTAWAGAQGHELGPAMWESYLSDPRAQPDPATWETRIAWPIR